MVNGDIRGEIYFFYTKYHHWPLMARALFTLMGELFKFIPTWSKS